MLNLFSRKEELPPISSATRGLVHKPYELGKVELREVEKAFARLFHSDDGQKVL